MTMTLDRPVEAEAEDAEVGITIMFASRGRPAALGHALWSLWNNADRPERLEARIAVDPDDVISARGLIGYDDTFEPGQIKRSRMLPPGTELHVMPERFGYTRLHDYLNALASEGGRTWSMWFNDDMRMLTPGWDTFVCNHRPAILWPEANHVQHANIAPIWPTSWADANNMVTPTTHMDTFLQRVGEYLGRHDRIPVKIEHQRADVTGLHDDQTYAEGRKLLGPEGMVGEFPSGLVGPFAERVKAEGLL